VACNRTGNAVVIREQLRLTAHYLSNFRRARPISEPYTPPAVPSGAPETRKPASTAKYVGRRNSDLYHLPGCRDVERIIAGNLVEYSEEPAGKRLHEGCPK
jgi:hypothetical protein